MMVADIPEDEIAALAFIVERHRERTGREPWDRPGIVAHLRKLDLEPADALAVALRAAADPSARMPIAMTWSQFRPARTAAGVPTGPVCVVCERSETTHHRMARMTGDTHPFQARETR